MRQPAGNLLQSRKERLGRRTQRSRFSAGPGKHTRALPGSFSVSPRHLKRVALAGMNWILRAIYDVARFVSLVLTKSMQTVNTSFDITKKHEGVAFEAIAALATPGPWGVITMGTFPLSLIAFGWIRRQKSEGYLALRPAT